MVILIAHVATFIIFNGATWLGFPIKNLGKEVFYQAGLPSLTEMLEFPPNSCLVFDDLFSQCCESKVLRFYVRYVLLCRNEAFYQYN